MKEEKFTISSSMLHRLVLECNTPRVYLSRATITTDNKQNGKDHLHLFDENAYHRSNMKHKIKSKTKNKTKKKQKKKKKKKKKNKKNKNKKQKQNKSKEKKNFETKIVLKSA